MSQGHAYGAVCSVCTCCDLVGASCPRYRFPLYAALYVWNMILKLLHVPWSCCSKTAPSVRAPIGGGQFDCYRLDFMLRVALISMWVENLDGDGGDKL